MKESKYEYEKCFVCGKDVYYNEKTNDIACIDCNCEMANGLYAYIDSLNIGGLKNDNNYK